MDDMSLRLLGEPIKQACGGLSIYGTIVYMDLSLSQQR